MIHKGNIVDVVDTAWVPEGRQTVRKATITQLCLQPCLLYVLACIISRISGEIAIHKLIVELLDFVLKDERTLGG